MLLCQLRHDCMLLKCTQSAEVQCHHLPDLASAGTSTSPAFELWVLWLHAAHWMQSGGMHRCTMPDLMSADQSTSHAFVLFVVSLHAAHWAQGALCKTCICWRDCFSVPVPFQDDTN